MTSAIGTLARAMAPVLVCDVRMGKPSDLAYVVDSWVKHAYRGMRPSPWVTHVRGLLARDGSRLLVAHVPKEPDAILGWAATEDPTAVAPPCWHYCYVRATARLMGVASSLVREWAHDVADYSSPCATAKPPKGWTFAPDRAKG